MTAIAGSGAQILAASGTSTSFTDETLTDAGDHKTYTIATSAHRYWDDSVVPVIQESTDSGSTWHTAAEAYTIQYVGGVVHFASANTSSNLYRAHSGKYFTITTIGGGHEWDLTTDLDLYDVTEFGQTFHTFIAGLVGGSGTINRFWIDTYFTTLILTGSARAIVALYTDTANGKRYEGYAFIKQEQLKVPVGGVVDETLGFTIDKTLYYNPGP